MIKNCGTFEPVKTVIEKLHVFMVAAMKGLIIFHFGILKLISHIIPPSCRFYEQETICENFFVRAILYLLKIN